MQFKSEADNPWMFAERKDSDLVPEDGRVKVGVDRRGCICVAHENLENQKVFHEAAQIQSSPNWKP